MDPKLVGPWAVRMLLLAVGGWLTRAFSVGDDVLWGNLADTLAGPIVVAGTAFWSWRATNAQVQQDPPGAPTVAHAATQAAESASAAVDEIAKLRRQVEELTRLTSGRAA